MYPDYKANRNPKLAKAIKYVKGKLDRAKNPKFKGGSPYSTDVPPSIPNVRTPEPPKLSQQIKSNLSKGTKLTDDQKKKNFADNVKSLYLIVGNIDTCQSGLGSAIIPLTLSWRGKQFKSNWMFPDESLKFLLPEITPSGYPWIALEFTAPTELRITIEEAPAEKEEKQ